MFYETLIDENAASHIALGSGYTLGVESAEDLARVNQSTIHVDFMIGSPELDVDGINRDGDTVPLLPRRRLADLRLLAKRNSAARSRPSGGAHHQGRRCRGGGRAYLEGRCARDGAPPASLATPALGVVLDVAAHLACALTE